MRRVLVFINGLGKQLYDKQNLYNHFKCMVGLKTKTSNLLTVILSFEVETQRNNI